MSTEELLIFGTGLGGTIPNSLYNLNNLRILDLMDNFPGLEGTLKTDIGKLVNLRSLKLNNNPSFEGTLPSELGLCHKLGEFLKLLKPLLLV